MPGSGVYCVGGLREQGDSAALAKGVAGDEVKQLMRSYSSRTLWMIIRSLFFFFSKREGKYWRDVSRKSDQR